MLAVGAMACQGEPARPDAMNEGSGTRPGERGAAEASRATAGPHQAPEAPALRPDGTIFAESELMGTRVTMNVWVGPGGDPGAAASAIRAAFDEMARIEQIASEWRANSDLNRLNAAAGNEAIELPRELIDILARAAEVSEASDGHFDVTFYAVGELWSFKPGARPPSPDAIAARLPLVNWRAVELDMPRSRARLRSKGMKVGLGAIAKGYGVDAASRVLRDAGFANHVVEGGGDTYASGNKAGEPWQIGLQHPRRGGAMGALSLQDLAVVTSGNYMRFFEWEGRRYTHILDPKTGFPILERESPRSVTCVAPNATDADAYCTALAVMGREQAMHFVAQRPTLEAIVIDHDDQVYVSAGLDGLWKAFDDPPTQ